MERSSFSIERSDSDNGANWLVVGAKWLGVKWSWGEVTIYLPIPRISKTKVFPGRRSTKIFCNATVFPQHIQNIVESAVNLQLGQPGRYAQKQNIYMKTNCVQSSPWRQLCCFVVQQGVVQSRLTSASFPYVISTPLTSCRYWQTTPKNGQGEHRGLQKSAVLSFLYQLVYKRTFRFIR